jgi:3-methyladenine DNA glycosylase/8-oxoguanine DNA glycosylase
VYQQLSVTVAGKIYQRVVEICGGDKLFTPASLLAKPFATLKKAGLSARKVEYLQCVARAFSTAEENAANAQITAMRADGQDNANGGQEPSKKQAKKVLPQPSCLSKQKLDLLSDEQVIKTLCRIKGIGEWRYGLEIIISQVFGDSLFNAVHICS